MAGVYRFHMISDSLVDDLSAVALICLFMPKTKKEVALIKVCHKLCQDVIIPHLLSSICTSVVRGPTGDFPVKNRWKSNSAKRHLDYEY